MLIAIINNSYYDMLIAIINNSYYYILIAIINNSYYDILIAIIDNSYYDILIAIILVVLEPVILSLQSLTVVNVCQRFLLKNPRSLNPKLVR